MNIFRENDVVRLRIGVEANIITGDEVFIPKGAEGTVVIVHGNADQPSAYEVEFFISEQNDFALATVDADLLCKV
ncbi:DUF4926 domain-containing protein [Pseudomonas lini]|jgi:alpha-beta hydrolase superfamily lysophospholipase|uniref:DUF4926 domain-containing protein n=1 Tax=Pseudomonas lini TaxID=163011 RepID=UPI00068226FB|nr:DUF4926 domain-containing protein [Pseudomonas lini]KNH47349.1 hypothetical protein ACS73_06225 [Pseudomonas lini]